MADNQQQSFFIGETCFCIPKQHVSAVISAQDILPLATVPDYVLGTFSHKDGRVVAISVAMQMGLKQAEYHPEHMIIVVEHGDVSVGLLVDRIGDDFAQQNWQLMPYHSELFSNASVHSNEVVIQLELGSLINKLDLNLADKVDDFHSQTFNQVEISGYTFAIPQNQIDFIVEPGKMTRIPMMPDYALGIFEDNQRTIQTISTAKKLGMPQQEHSAFHRVLVVKRDNEYFGFLVDAVNDQSQTKTQRLSPLPNLTRAGLLPAMLTLEDQTIVPILDLDVLYHAAPISRSLKLDERLDYQVIEEPVETDESEVSLEAMPSSDEQEAAVNDEESTTEVTKEIEEQTVAEEDIGIQLPEIDTTSSSVSSPADEDARFESESDSRELNQGFFRGKYERRQGITRVRGKSFWKRTMTVLLIALLIICSWLFINPSTESEMVRSRFVQYSSWLQRSWISYWQTDDNEDDAELPYEGHRSDDGYREPERLELPETTDFRTTAAAVKSEDPKSNKETQNRQHVVEIDLADKTMTIEQRHKMNKPEPIKKAMPGEIQHIVVEGDTLWDIAEKYLDDPFAYPELARLSRIKDPDLIYPGDVVTIRKKN